MPNEIYHRSNWGESKAEGFGDVYYDHAATNKLYNHSDYYENSDGTDATLKDLNNKASIVLTPTAYSDGSLNTVIPPYQVLPTELVTNGTFDTDSDWLKSSTATISNGSAHIVSDGSYQYIGQVLVLTVGKKYRVEYEIVENNSGSLKMSSSFGSNFNPISSTVGFHSFEAVAIASTLYIERQSSCDIKIDNVSVKEIQEADFDFSRGSSATRVNEQGLVEDVQILSGELVQNGDFEQIGVEEVTNGDFETDSDWTKGTGWTIANGKATVTNSTVNSIYQDILDTSKIYKATFEITDITSGSLRIGIGINFSDYFTETGTYTYYGKPTTDGLLRINPSSGTNASIDNVSVKEVGQNWSFGTGWSMGDGKVVADGTMSLSDNLIQSYNFIDGNKYRFSFTISDYQSGSIFIRQPFSGFADAVSANGTFTFDRIAGSANEIRFRSNDGFIGSLDNVSYKEVTDDTDLPRIDFTDGTGSLLLEPQRTNLVTYSEDFNAYRVAGSTVTPNSTTAPDGTNSGILVTQGVSTLVLRVPNVVAPSTIYTFSGYFKSSGSVTQVKLDITDENITAFDLTNEWQRFSVTAQSKAGGSPYHFVDVDTNGSQGDTFYAWGLQVEQADYATSYIPTSGSTVTRSADVANNSGNADLFNDSEGVLYAEIAALANDGTNRSISISDSTDANRIELRLATTDDRIQYNARTSSVTQASIFTDAYNVLDFNKIALLYKDNDFRLFVNGTQVATDTSGTAPTGLKELAFDLGDSSNDFYGDVKCVAVFKEALSNDLLERLTGEGYESFRLLAEANNYTII